MTVVSFFFQYSAGHNPTHQAQLTTQTWPFVEIFAHKRYFYLEAQSFTIDGHPEIFLWLWFLGNFSLCNYQLFKEFFV